MIAGSQVHLQSFASKKMVRAQANGIITANGGRGAPATWIVHVTPVGTVKFQNLAVPRHFLRLGPQGVVSCGPGGPFCDFAVIQHPGGLVSLRCVKNPNMHVGFLPGGLPKNGQLTKTGPQGRFAVLPKQVVVAPIQHVVQQVFQQPVPTLVQQVPMVQVVAAPPFVHGRHCHLQSLSTSRNLRSVPTGGVDGLGGMGQWATWLAHVIGPNRVKLQNVKKPATWLCIGPGGALKLGAGGPHCDFVVQAHGGTQISLAKAMNPGMHVGIRPNGHPKPAGQTATGPHGRFNVIVK